ncbi:MAG: DUF1761 domain-containing protein [Elusimicrobia bacterium]|nr:DUF1761 domain-containing protein [Elusimicrobiota bacterium]
MRRGFWWATLGYAVVTLVLGMIWHFVWFHNLYHQLGIYNRQEPIIPLGMLSMLIQGLVLAYLYPFFYKAGHPITQGITYGLLMGLYMYSVSTLANAAKIVVAPISTWLGIQALFHAVQFVLAGALIGLAYGRTGTHGV